MLLHWGDILWETNGFKLIYIRLGHMFLQNRYQVLLGKKQGMNITIYWKLSKSQNRPAFQRV